jgi:hypothetical protein
LDENLPSAECFKHPKLPCVADAYSFRKNGWRGLKDDEVILKIKEMADQRPEFLFIVLTRDLGFIEDSRCEKQRINIRSGNLRILELSWETFFPVNRTPPLRAFGNIRREKALGVIRKYWPKVLKETIRS